VVAVAVLERGVRTHRNEDHVMKRWLMLIVTSFFSVPPTHPCCTTIRVNRFVNIKQEKHKYGWKSIRVLVFLPVRVRARVQWSNSTYRNQTTYFAALRLPGASLEFVLLPLPHAYMCNDIVTWSPKAGIVKSELTLIARQRLTKHIPATTNTQAKI
jgi:hypothetical protein